MKTRKSESPGTTRPFGQAGFTLVELLVVISIILLLAMLLMPTVQRIILQVYVGRSAMMVRRLHDGTMIYKERTKFLPGEKTKDDATDPRVDMASGTTITGSQVLAACLFNLGYTDVKTKDFSQPENSKTIDASKVYATFKPEYLITYEGKLNAISDGFPKGKAKPICYFLASNNLNDNNKVTQFNYNHNRSYMYPQASTPRLSQTALNAWILSRSVSSNQILNNGEFILIAAGLNRDYLVHEVENPADENRPLQEPDPDDIANDYGGSTQ